MHQIISVCSFSVGRFTVKSKSGKQTLDFEDSDHFGPTKVEMRTGNLSEIGATSWFWDFYDAWRAAGCPTSSASRSTPNGPLEQAVWAPSSEGGV